MRERYDLYYVSYIFSSTRPGESSSTHSVHQVLYDRRYLSYSDDTCSRCLFGGTGTVNGTLFIFLKKNYFLLTKLVREWSGPLVEPLTRDWVMIPENIRCNTHIIWP